MPHWVDQEFVGQDFRDEDLAGLRTERVVFTDHCLATDAAFAEVQFVSCRNVLIYLTSSDKIIEGSPKNAISVVPFGK